MRRAHPSPWYVPRALRRLELSGAGRAGAALLASAAAVLLAAGCGAKPRQDTDEPVGFYDVKVTEASFPEKQKLAKRSRMRITVRNVDTRTVPNLSVTVSGFDERGAEKDSPLADPTKPMFSLNAIPQNSETSYSNTFAVGKVRPGQEKELVWDVTAIKAGPFTLNWKISAGLDGKARARLPGGDVPHGRFEGRVIAGEPVAKVDKKNGRTIVRDGDRIGPRDE